MKNVNDIRLALKKEYAEKKLQSNGTYELIGAQFIADEPSMFGKINTDYAAAELEWFLKATNNLKDLNYKPTPKAWCQITNLWGEVNSNYGYQIFKSGQYKKCLDILKSDPNTRRAIMVYIGKNYYEISRQNGMEDYLCCWGSQYFIRDNELITVVSMRSNDAVIGYRNDVLWHRYIQAALAKELKIKIGLLIWNAGSFHVYKKDSHYLK